MPRTFYFLTAVFLFASLGFVFGANSPADMHEFEVGVSLFPIIWEKEENPNTVMPENETNSFFNYWLIGFHFGYNFSVLYTTWDAFIVPPGVIQDSTTQIGDDGSVTEGYYRPGFINFFNVGLKFTIAKTVLLFATTGLNYLYVYRQHELPPNTLPSGFGVNLRLGGGIKFNQYLGLTFTGTTLFSNFSQMGKMFANLGNGGSAAGDAALGQIKFLPALTLNVHL